VLGPVMISERWRERLTYLAMSAFIGWHTLAVVVAPAPDSRVTQSLRVLLQPYLTLFWLDNSWDFFAPYIGKGYKIRYVIEDSAGKSHAFVPIDEISWHHPMYRRMTYWFNAIIDDPDTYADRAAALFCQKHASLRPVSISLIQVQELEFTPEDHLSGKHPLDPEFVTETILKHDACPDK
jgi:hypothetical protein